MSQTKVVGAVEIGTSKVSILMGEIIGNSELNIIGHSSSTSRGVKKGVITDLKAASDCVHAAIMAAEENTGTRIDEVYLAQTGSHLQGDFNLGTTTVSASDSVIRAADIEEAKKDAKRRRLEDTRTYIHHIQNPFLVDGQMVDNPLSKQGKRLEVGYWSVHGSSQAVSDNLRVIRGIDLDVGDIIVSSIASGAVLLEESEKENGTLVVDIGGGTTDFVLYRKGYIVLTGVVPVGGDHITNDLSIGLRIGRNSAEEIKLKSGRAYSESEDRNKKSWLYGDLSIGDREYPLTAITKIIEARVSEIFEIIKHTLDEKKLLAPDDIASGVVLTGGTSRLEGIAAIATRTLGLEARSSAGPLNVAEELRLPEYSTVLGLLHYALTGQGTTSSKQKSGGFLRRLSNMLSR
ncbi:MAG: cell division protein FtsA [Zhongshania aliphaticivorans]|jgi:cell division protein FtsA